MAKIQSALFFMGMGVGMILNSFLPIPEQLGFIKQALWLIFILIGVYLVINSSG